MNGDPDRVAAAKACRVLLEAARRSDEIRLMIMKVASNRGHESIFAYADADPEAVCKLAAEVTFLEEQTS